MVKSYFFLAVIILIVGMAGAEDFVKYDTPIAKDLSNLNLSEINAIFGSDDGWFISAGPSLYTPSQMAFLKGNADEGVPMGNVSPKHVYIGAVNPGNVP